MAEIFALQINHFGDIDKTIDFTAAFSLVISSVKITFFPSARTLALTEGNYFCDNKKQMPLLFELPHR